MFRLGLTGSIATGKSATAALFRARGIPVYDADAAVHALYAGEAVPLIERAFAGTTQAGKVDRTKLGQAVAGDADKFAALEAIIHPLVRQCEQAAIAAAKAAHARLIVLDIPLLFETKAQNRCHAVLLTHVSREEQRRRALARPGMNEALLKSILARQMPLAQKRQSAHFLLDTAYGHAQAAHEIEALLRALQPALSKPDLLEAAHA